MQIRARIDHSQVPPDVVVLRASTREGLSEIFDIQVEFACDTPDLDLASCIGSSGALILEPALSEGDVEPRCFHGVVEEAEYLRKVAAHGFVYRFRLRPLLHGLAFRARSRIFQEQSTVEIIQAVLKDSGIPDELAEWQLSSDYVTREYCAQWKESELAFVLRLLEDEGIFFWFEHSATEHMLKLADSSAAYTPIPGAPHLPFTRRRLADAETECVTELVFSTQLSQDAFATRDWNWQLPENPLEAEEKLGEGGTFRRYEYPGLFRDPADGTRRAGNRLSELSQLQRVLEARSNCLRLVPGHIFTVLDAVPGYLCQEYLLLQVVHDYALVETESGHKVTYGTRLRAIPANGADFRPPRITPRPRIWGRESAVVTGPPGQEIHVDEFGRIKVHFYWDREGPVDDTASCWLRVQQQNTSGTMLLPRVGWEVDVGFLDGNPDRPVVLQKLYNQETMPPYGLPDEQTQSSLQSATSPGGGGTNELRLQDGNGGMEFFIHSSKDLKLVTGHNLTEEVAVDAKEEVGVQSTSLVGGSQTVQIGANQKLSVKGSAVLETSSSKNVQVGAVDDWGITGNYTASIDGSRTETISGPMNVLANHVLESFNASHDRTVGAALSVNSATAIVEAVGGSKDETVAGAKMELLKGPKAEDIGLGKVLSAGVVQLKAGGDMLVEAKGAVAITAAGTISEKVGKDFALTAKSVQVTAPGGVKLKGGGKEFKLSGSTITIDAEGLKGGVQVQLKGKLNYKG